MDDRRSNWQVPVIVALALASLFAFYIGAYIATGQAVHAAPGSPVAARVYPSRWHAIVFTPAAKVESTISGSNVEIAWADGNTVWQSAPP
jgi:hypothetical protein